MPWLVPHPTAAGCSRLPPMSSLYVARPAAGCTRCAMAFRFCGSIRRRRANSSGAVSNWQLAVSPTKARRPQMPRGLALAVLIAKCFLLMTTILDGNKIGAQIRSEVAEETRKLAAIGIRPGLAVILAGNNAASEIYVRNKVKASEQ